MSRYERPRDLWWAFGAVRDWLQAEVRGEHGGPERTAFSRIVVMTLVLLFAGSTLWSAFVALLPTILVVAGVVVGLKLLHRVLHP